MKKSKRPFKRWEKIIREDQDWDFGFLWRLEYTKICHMLQYWLDYRDNIGGVPKYKCTDSKTNEVIRDLRWCKSLLDIMMDSEGGVWDIDLPGFDTEPCPDHPGCYQVIEKPGINEPERCKRVRYFNYHNCYRFYGLKTWKSREEIMKKATGEKGYPCFMACSLENDARLQKAKYLYHKIRTYKDELWWE